MGDLVRIDQYLGGAVSGRTIPDDDVSGFRLNEDEVNHLNDLLGIRRCPTEFLPAGADRKDVHRWAEKAAALAGESGRVVLKVVGRDILHKTEIGGVRVIDLADAQQGPAVLLEAWENMESALSGQEEKLPVEGCLAGAFIPHRPNQPGQEILLSLKQDPAFGPCVVLGIGGTLTEWYGRAASSTLIFPAEGLAPAMVRSAVNAHPLLKILAGPSRLYDEGPFRAEELVRAVMALAELGLHCGPAGASEWTVEELEINPAVATSDGVTALDGVGLVSRRKWARVSRPAARIEALLKPRSAVVMGVSARVANPGRIILQNLVKSEGLDPARLYVVHHREKTIGQVPCVAEVTDLPEKCDLAVVAIPAEGALKAITDLVENDAAESIILIPGGFAETGETSLATAIEDVLARGHARPRGGPVMVGGNCLGIVSRGNYNTFFLPEYKLPFRPGAGENLAVVSQSGAYLVTFASNYDGIIQPAASISFGNQMDLTVGDFLEHFNGEAGIDVVACYVEGFRPGDGARFLNEVRRARSLGKRVIIYKAGKTALGARAAASHTASLAGDYAVARSCLESAGATVAESLDEFEDLLKTFTLLAGKPVGGTRTGIISNAGFECSTVMDQLEGLDLAEFDAATQDRLDEVLPGFAHRSNPIDCTPMTGTAAFADSCRAILECPGVDVAILSSVPVTPTLDNLPADPHGYHRENLLGPESQPSLMVDIIGGSAKPAVVVVDSGRIYDPMCRIIEKAGIPVFRKIDRAARALAAFCRGEEAGA
ncbi:MAG: acetate--CoA ligase family protein [Candidatus Krumholzibacteriota bacterium]